MKDFTRAQAVHDARWTNPSDAAMGWNDAEPEDNGVKVPDISILRRYWNDAEFRAEIAAERDARMKQINAEISFNMEAARLERIKDRAYREMMDAAIKPEGVAYDPTEFDAAAARFRAAREAVDAHNLANGGTL